MKSLVRDIVRVAVLGAAAGLVIWALGRTGGRELFAPKVSEQATLSILKNEALSFLVTRRTATQVVVQHEESDLLGEWHGILWATVNWRWGVDLQKIEEKDIRREGDRIICKLPEPQLLDFGIEPGSVGFMSKSTAVPKIKETLGSGYQRQTLESRLKDQAMKFASDSKLCPGRAELVQQLNGAVGALTASTGLELRFE